MNIILLGNALSFIASVIMILMGFIKKKDRFLLAQCGMNAFFIAGNLFLGGISGAIANAVTMTRNIVCLKWNLNRTLKLFFIALQIGLVLLSGTDSLVMWLPIIGNCVFTWYMDSEDMALFKGIVIGSQFLWGIYDFYIMNYATVPFDVCSCITNAFAMAAIMKSRKRTRFPAFDHSIHERSTSMNSFKQKISNCLMFLHTDARLKERIERDYIDNGIATIPCHVSGIGDIISPFSVKGYEIVSPELEEYIEASAAFIPAGYPIVLELSGCIFSEEEQKNIREAIHEAYLYELGAVQKENRKQLIVALLMFVGMLLTGIVTFQSLAAGALLEILYIFFWIFADVAFCYILFDQFSNRKKRLLAGRLADLVVCFSEQYDDSAVTDEDAATVYREIERLKNDAGMAHDCT